MRRSRAPVTLRECLGSPRQSSAALGRATGARPVPHSAHIAHHFSADRVTVAYVSISWSAEQKVTLDYRSRVTSIAPKLSAQVIQTAKKKCKIRECRDIAENSNWKFEFLCRNIVKSRDGGADNRDNFFGHDKREDLTIRREWCKHYRFKWFRRVNSDLKSRALQIRNKLQECAFFMFSSTFRLFLLRECVRVRVCSWSERINIGDDPVKKLRSIVLGDGNRTFERGTDCTRGRSYSKEMCSVIVFSKDLLTVRLVCTFSTFLFFFVIISAHRCQENDWWGNICKRLTICDKYNGKYFAK